MCAYENSCVMERSEPLRRLKTLIRVAVVIIIIAGIIMGIIMGIIYGFPWERIIAAHNARNDVKETYGFTATKKSVSMLLDYPVIVTVSTKENLFDFGVDMSRSDLNDISDDYLKRMAEYTLGRNLNDYVEKITGQRAKAYVYLQIGRIHEFSLNELKANSNIAFEKLEGCYYSTIRFNNDISNKDYQVDYSMIYDIYRHLFEYGLKPVDINITYNYGDSYLRITIEQEDFQNIKSSEDLRPYFEKAIEQKRK